MNHFALITCLFVILGAVLASPTVRESRHAVPVGIVDGLVLVDDDAVSQRVLSSDGAVPTIISARSTGAVPFDQQTEQQRLSISLGGPGYGGFYGGRPGYGRPWGPGYGRPWGPYGRPWGPYTPYRPWGPY
ncbi:hypothetical protein DAPPUDRAFT_315889 [Daphnia pulex]|uniref:Uncharacterized protein n=1 Tax=Daphnia pulex TaxID=6669 RepID=E9GB62_DAPPU|nr:hypothetical protein DAPPUDRAFT_315889 [Daphnia pulex]|eukprot:EFX83420.1 hypothetical protein DAPPUDRAFT_315889 [Daphnia pulex]